MANYSELIATINDQIKANGNQEITGPVLNAVLQAMVSALGEGYQFMGVATPNTNPGTPDGKVFYVADKPGIYSNFGVTVNNAGLYVIYNINGSWTVTGAALPYIYNVDILYPRSGKYYTMMEAIDTVVSPYRGMLLTYYNRKQYLYQFTGAGDVNSPQFWRCINPDKEIDMPIYDVESGYVRYDGMKGTSANLITNKYKFNTEGVKYIKIPVFNLGTTADARIGLAFYTRYDIYVCGVRYLDILGRENSINRVEYVKIPVPQDCDYFYMTYLSDSYRTQLGIDDAFIVSLIYDDSSDGDIDYTYMPRKIGYMDTDIGEFRTSTGNQTFFKMQPIYGKKYIVLTVPIFMSEFNRGICFYDAHKTFISGIPCSSIYINDQQRCALDVYITIPKNAEYFLPTFWETDYAISNNVNIQLAKCKLTDIPEKTLPDISTLPGFIDFADWDGVSGETLTAWTYNDLISVYDSLQAAHPERVSQKAIIGYASTSDSGNIATKDMALPIYEYVISPFPKKSLGYEEYASTFPQNTVKVLIATGVHGNEKSASTGVLFFVKQILESTDEKIIALSQNCIFHVIPCVSPYGYNNNQRNNARNVNINRNFSYNWEHQAGGNVSEKGPQPYSEQETIAVQSWMSDNSDMDIYIDVHDSNVASSPSEGIFCYTYSPFVEHLWASYERVATPYALSRYPKIFIEKQQIGFAGFVMTSGTITEAYFVHGCPFVMTAENNRALGGSQNKAEQVELSYNQLINIINKILFNAIKSVRF